MIDFGRQALIMEFMRAGFSEREALYVGNQRLIGKFMGDVRDEVDDMIDCGWAKEKQFYRQEYI